jgi:lysophospholipase L1-like esterase
MIKKNATILFQGDSITACGRCESNTIGNGYPRYISALFKAQYPELNVKFINRAISGNRANDLVNRWTEDCINIKPDILSILVGINDTWRRYDSNNPTTAEEFYNNYKNLLTRVKSEVGDIPIIIMEPFLLQVKEGQGEWREDLDPKIQMLRLLAQEFAAIYIPLDGMFAQNSMKIPLSYWVIDGVHPTEAGHGLITKLWLKEAGVNLERKW